MKSIPLPSIYNVVLPPESLHVPDDKIPVSPGEPMPDSADPLRTVSPFHIDIKMVATAAELPDQNMYRRVVEIMQNLAPQDAWSAGAESALQSNLPSVGLLLPFTRPRTRLARRAMFHAIAELVDAGRLPKKEAESL